MRPKHPQQGYALVGALVGASLATVAASGVAASLVASSRVQHRQRVAQDAADQLQLARSAVAGSTAPPTTSGPALAAPHVPGVPGCFLAVLDDSGAPLRLQLEATCVSGPETAVQHGWAVWAPPPPPPPG